MGTENGLQHSGPSVFDPELMAEKVKVGDKELVIAPLTMKRYRQLIGVVDESITMFAKMDKAVQMGTVMDIVMERDLKILAICFSGHDFMTKEFIEDNMTNVMVRELVSRCVFMNRMEDMYPFLINKQKPEALKPEAVPSPVKSETTGG